MEIYDRRGDGGKVRLMFQDKAGFGRIDKRPLFAVKNLLFADIPAQRLFLCYDADTAKEAPLQGENYHTSYLLFAVS